MTEWKTFFVFAHHVLGSGHLILMRGEQEDYPGSKSFSTKPRSSYVIRASMGVRKTWRGWIC